MPVAFPVAINDGRRMVSIFLQISASSSYHGESRVLYRINLIPIHTQHTGSVDDDGSNDRIHDGDQQLLVCLEHSVADLGWSHILERYKGEPVAGDRNKEC